MCCSSGINLYFNFASDCGAIFVCCVASAIGCLGSGVACNSVYFIL